MVVISRSNHCPGHYRANELMRFGATDFYKVYGTNQYIAIRQFRRMNISGLTSVVIQEESHEPIYKQYMRMQMGQRPKIVEYRRSYRVKALTEAELHGKLFELYETV